MRLLLISGSLRAGSTNGALLRTVEAVAPRGLDTDLYEGMASLPHFNPDDDLEGAPPAAVADLRTRIARADVVLVSTPEYAGALPGSFKNLLEWTVGGSEMYGKPVAWINASGPAAPTGGTDAHHSLSKVLGYISAEVIEPACVRIPVARDSVGEDGLVDDPEVRAALGELFVTLSDQLGDQSGLPET